MEKSTKLKSVALNAGWSDMGNWGSILRESEKDDQGCFISGNVMAESCSGSLLVSNSQDLEMLALGLKNLVVVSSNDAVLIADRERTNDIKPLLDALKKKGVNQAENFKNYRPGHL